MTAEARLEKATAILALLTSETRFATNMERMFARCADKADVLDAFSYTSELWGFEVTREALHMTLISTLGRIHVSLAAPGDNRSDAGRRRLAGRVALHAHVTGGNSGGNFRLR